MASSGTFVSNFDDGTGYPFMVNWDGEVGPEDHRKSLGVFAGGTEIVFFLAAYFFNDPDKDWDDPALDPNWVFYTKKDWNADSYRECEPAPADPDRRRRIPVFPRAVGWTRMPSTDWRIRILSIWPCQVLLPCR